MEKLSKWEKWTDVLRFSLTDTCHNVWDNGHCISKIYLQNTIIDTMRLFDCKIEGNL